MSEERPRLYFSREEELAARARASAECAAAPRTTSTPNSPMSPEEIAEQRRNTFICRGTEFDWQLRQDLAELLLPPPETKPTKIPGSAVQPIARRIGARRYQVGDSRPFMLTVRQDTVLTALMSCPGAVATLPELRELSACDDANKLLREIMKKTPLHPYITMPGGKGKGSYSTRVVNSA
jgi:hypothetical protein